MRSLQAGVQVVACCIVVLLSESFAQGKPSNSRSVTLNGAVTYDYSIHRLKDLGLEDDRVLFYIPSFKGALLLDEADEYHFLTNNMLGRIFLETKGKQELIGIHFTKQGKNKTGGQKTPYKDLRLEDIRSLRGIYLEDKPSDLVLQLLTYLDPENAFVSVKVPFFSRQEKDEFPPINPEIKFLKIYSSRSLNKTSYAHLKKMHALEFLNMDSGNEAFDLGLLESCTHLAYLNLGNEPIQNLHILETLKELRWLNLSRCNEVDNIEFVQNLPELRFLGIYSTPICDLTPIQDLKHIEFVGATGSAVSRIPQKTVRSLVDLKIVATNVDVKQAEAFAKNNPQCKVSYGWNQALQKALKGVTHLKVVSGATWISELEDGTRVEDKNHLLFETNDPDDLESLIQYIEIDLEGDVGFCGCHGDPILKFYKGDELAVVLSHHHGERLRWAGGEWPCDGTLTDGSRSLLLAWFDDHGMPEPKKEYEEDLRQEKKNQAERGKLVAAMPTSLSRFFTGFFPNSFGKSKILEMNKALLEQYPKERDRILALLGWYGAGGGSWDSFFAYESAAQDLLRLYSATNVLEAILQSKLSQNQAGGAARYLINDKTLLERKLVPIELKAKLLEYSLKSGNRDNWEKARAVFNYPSVFNVESIFVDPFNPNCTSVDGILMNKKKTVLIRCPTRKKGAVSIPESVTQIQEYAFDGCSEITQITIPESVTMIESFAFCGCSNLTQLTLPNSIGSIESYTFDDSGLRQVLIPNSVTNIAFYAFVGCNELPHVSIPASVKTIEVPFSGCASLTNIAVDPANPNYSSENGILMNKEKTVLVQYPAGRSGAASIPEGTTNIFLNAFENCSNLTQIIIPDSVEKINENAFRGCSKLTQITIPDRVVLIDCGVFENSGLRQIEIPNTVTNIDAWAFSGCSRLTQITILDGVEEIWEWAFSGCESITQITLPASIELISDGAFKKCSALESVYFLGDAPEMEDDAFEGTKATLYYLPNTTGWGGTVAGRPSVLRKSLDR